MTHGSLYPDTYVVGWTFQTTGPKSFGKEGCCGLEMNSPHKALYIEGSIPIRAVFGDSGDWMKRAEASFVG